MFDLPELLCPAGDPAALAAAVEAGADAVYFGACGFNARKHATNFTESDMREAIKLAHAYGVKVYITQNTLILDRELSAYLSAAESALSAGADALIVADMGGAAEIRRHFPQAELHASTQMSGHNVDAAKRLAALGFSRMVCAREMSLGDLRTFTEQSPIEAEVFVHGALCVCHSGQCLFSSVVGGRSGNRGECAQPCRLPFAGKRGEAYPLSLKDLALAEHIPALIEAGISSLKIEGRMKSPEYVRDVARIYRRLLDERRGATPDEMKLLAEVFSRGGFTDGYFRGKVDGRMLGVRSERDKQTSRELVPFRGIERKIPLRMEAEVLCNRPIRLTVCAGEKTGRAEGPVPFAANNAPLTRESVTERLSKLGGTPYVAETVHLTLDEGLMTPMSALNALRRDAIADMEREEDRILTHIDAPRLLPTADVGRARTARFQCAAQIPQEAHDYFDCMYLPLEHYDGSVEGVVMPPVIFDGERPRVEALLKQARERGAKYALVGNIGHLSMVVDHGLIPHGDFRLNVTNGASMAVAEQLGFSGVILSPELTLPQIRDIGGDKSMIVYGRLPLMILEKCVGREIGDCTACEKNGLVLTDRRGAKFPVLRAFDHRSLICNSIPTCTSDMTDRVDAIGACGKHYIFTVETAEECRQVIDAFRNCRPLPTPVRRIGRN